MSVVAPVWIQGESPVKKITETLSVQCSTHDDHFQGIIWSIVTQG